MEDILKSKRTKYVRNKDTDSNMASIQTTAIFSDNVRLFNNCGIDKSLPDYLIFYDFYNTYLLTFGHTATGRKA